MNVKVFISYHRADKKYMKKIVEILKENNIASVVIDEKQSFNEWSHQKITEYVRNKMKECNVLLSIVGKDTYSRPHVDYEIHEALKGDVNSRKGIIAVMLETRLDNKNNIDLNTFPTKLKDNLNYIVIEQYSSIRDKILNATNKALKNKKDANIKTNHSNKVMQLRSGKYYDI